MVRDLIFLVLGLIVVAFLLIAVKGFRDSYIDILKDIEDDSR